MKCFIKLGKINLKLLYPFLCLIFSIIEALVEAYAFERKRGHVIVSLLINAFSKILVAVGYILIKLFFYRDLKLIENTEKDNLIVKLKRQKLLNNKIIFCIIMILSYVTYIVYYVVSRTENQERPKEGKLFYVSHNYGFYFGEGMEIIFIYFLMKFLLVEEVYIMNLINLIIFFIISILMDIVYFGNVFYISGGIKCFFFIVLIFLFESIIVIYQKNMMQSLYYSPFLVTLIFGLIDFILTIILGTITTLKDGLYCNQTKKGMKCYLPSIKTYFEEDFLFIDFISILSNIFFKAVTYLLNIHTIFYLSPNHIFIIYTLGKLFENINDGYYNKWTFIIAPFQLFNLVIYLEILELDCCGINLNTKKNIEIRADEEFLSQNGSDRESFASIDSIDSKDNNKEEKNKAEMENIYADIDDNYKVKLIDEPISHSSKVGLINQLE